MPKTHTRATWLLIIATLTLAGLLLRPVPESKRLPPPAPSPLAKAAPDVHLDPEKRRRMAIYHYNQGNAALKEGKWDDAVHYYKMALDHNAEIPEVYINLSTAYLRLQRFDEAYATLTALEKKSDGNPSLYYNLACYYSLTGKPEPGLDALRRAVGLGYKNFKEIGIDPDLANLRQSPAFAAWFKTAQNEK